MKSATKWILFFAVQVNKCHISRANFSRIVNYNWIVIAFSQSINLSKPFVSGCCYYDNAFNFHPNSSASLTLFSILDLRYDGYSQHLFTKLCFFFRVWHAYIFEGLFDVNHDEASSLDICQHHRDLLGIYWRGRCKNCQVPPEMAQHKSAAVKGDRSLLKDQSQYIKKIKGKLIPVGSGKKVSYFLNILVFAFPKQLPERISRVVKFPEREVRISWKKHTLLISSDRYSSQKRKRNMPPPPATTTKQIRTWSSV